MALKRITITIPGDLLREADRRAKALDRSRSWVVAAALRAELAPPATPAPPLGVREPARSPSAAEFAFARSAHLVRDLTLSPTERLRQAEELAHFADEVHPPRRVRDQVIGFDTYEDFYAWKRTRRISV